MARQRGGPRGHFIASFDPKVGYNAVRGDMVKVTGNYEADIVSAITDVCAGRVIQINTDGGLSVEMDGSKIITVAYTGVLAAGDQVEPVADGKAVQRLTTGKQFGKVVLAVNTVKKTAELLI